MVESRVIPRENWLKNKQTPTTGRYNIAICDSGAEDAESHARSATGQKAKVVRSIWFWSCFGRFQSRTLSPFGLIFGVAFADGMTFLADRP
jgi:hypothetical protein